MSDRKSTRCEFCGRPGSWPMCKACGVSYERYSHNRGDVMGALLWAARRTRRYAAKDARRRESAIRALAADVAQLRRVIERQADALRAGGE
jgi:hypothetical protein